MSEHYYSRDGAPAYTVIGKNGKERNTTIRDVRLLNLVPSTTTIINCASKPFLQQWKEQQILNAAWLNPYMSGQCSLEWKRVISRSSKEIAMKASEEGAKVHDMLELFYKGDKKNKNHPIVKAVDKELKKRFGKIKWIAEQSFSHPLGYGGKCDLYSPEGNIVLDFKTKNTSDISKMICYDDHPMQLSSYRVGLGVPEARCVNVFISTMEPGLIKIIEHPENELRRAWGMFNALLDYWYLSNRVVRICENT